MAAQFAKDTRYGTVIGRKTMGNALGSTMFNVGGGYKLYLPIFGWHSPNGIYLERSGVAPDISIDVDPKELPCGQDVQLRTAIAMLDCNLQINRNQNISAIESRIRSEQPKPNASTARSNHVPRRIFSSAALAIKAKRVKPCASAASSIARNSQASREMFAFIDRPPSRIRGTITGNAPRPISRLTSGSAASASGERGDGILPTASLHARLRA